MRRGGEDLIGFRSELNFDFGSLASQLFAAVKTIVDLRMCRRGCHTHAANLRARETVSTPYKLPRCSSTCRCVFIVFGVDLA